MFVKKVAIVISKYLHIIFVSQIHFCDRYLDIDGMWCYGHSKLLLLLSCYQILLQLSSPPPPLTTVLVQLSKIEFMEQKWCFVALCKVQLFLFVRKGDELDIIRSAEAVGLS